MWELPTYVVVGDREYDVRNKADYRVIIDVIAALDDAELTDAERAIAALMIFYDDVNDIEDVFNIFHDVQAALNSMMNCINCNDNEIGHNAKIKLIDWVQDEKLISSAVNKVAGVEVRTVPYMHWWTFIGHYMSI